MKILITTQVQENYGTSAEPYWKFKGGRDFVVENVEPEDFVDVLVDRASAQIECDNEGYREWVLGYKLVANDYMTDYEKSQLEYEGKITYPCTVLTVGSV